MRKLVLIIAAVVSFSLMPSYGIDNVKEILELSKTIQAETERAKAAKTPEEQEAVVKELERLNPCRIIEHLRSIEPVFIGTDTPSFGAAHHEFEEIGEEIHLCAHGLHRIVETGVLVGGQVQLTVDVTAPDNILRHLHGRGKGDTCPLRHVLRVGLLRFLLLLLLYTPFGRLGADQ